MQEEKRRSLRIKKSLTAQYKNENSMRWDMTTIKDISQTGMCIITDRSFVSNEVVNFRIKIPSRPFEWLDVNGRVIGANEGKTSIYITRVEFIDLNEEHKKIIKEYIDSIALKGGG